ncbi:hypothetical protein V1499_23160 (plasmid) [Neobacillus sp. SCS-31]|uniref:hypothetical protein n=1 Tax=Neobacillus oceani TaxID=3115292 RepID=UPI003906BD88
MKSYYFKRNAEIIQAKGSIPLWLISSYLNVHENTVRNWMRREMDQEKKSMVLAAIEKAKKEMAEIH